MAGLSTGPEIVVSSHMLDCTVRSEEGFRQVIAELVKAAGEFRPAIHGNSPMALRDHHSRHAEIRSLADLEAGWYSSRNVTNPATEKSVSETAETIDAGCGLLCVAPWWPARPMISLALIRLWKGEPFSIVNFGDLVVPAGDPYPQWLKPGAKPARELLSVPGDLNSKVMNLNAYMSDLFRFVREFAYPRVEPQLGVVGELWYPGKRQGDVPRYIAQRRLDHLEWVTIFGPAYVEEYGREFLLQAPGLKTEELANGGIIYQVTKDFVHLEEPTPSAAEVTEYFRSHRNVERVEFRHKLVHDHIVEPQKAQKGSRR